MDFYEMTSIVDDSVAQFIACAEEVKPEVCGLDNRAGYKLFITEDVIACSMSADKNLQYYGGFEYVDQEYRSVMGGYVFYSGDDERVQEHIQKWIESK
jgi:hypothetical protein